MQSTKIFVEVKILRINKVQSTEILKDVTVICTSLSKIYSVSSKYDRAMPLENYNVFNLLNIYETKNYTSILYFHQEGYSIRSPVCLNPFSSNNRFQPSVINPIPYPNNCTKTAITLNRPTFILLFLIVESMKFNKT